MKHLTFNELERAAYISGNVVLADAYAAMDKLEAMDSDLPMGFDFDQPLDQQIENYVEEQIAKQCPDYEAYKQFFYDCFDRLDGHYPCPSIGSDYDQSVIFNAISKEA